MAYMAPHAYWALGGRLGLSAIMPGVSDLAIWRPINAAASVILLCAALVGIALAWSERPRLSLLAIACVGCSVAVVHGVYGVVARASVVAADGVAHTPPYIWWDLVVFEPWFFVEGLLLGLTGWLSLPDGRGRRVWVWASVAALAAATVTSLLHVHFA
jgi:hypothetical protein